MISSEIFIIKRDGKREVFSLDKIKNAIAKAFLSVGSFATQDVITNVLSRVSVSDGTSVEEIQNQVEVDFNAEYVLLTLNGALLFDSGKSEIRQDAYPLIDKIGAILTNYKSNIIEIEGHTDNVPISNVKYENNDVLSMYRALNVADYIRSITDLDPGLIKSSGRGEYVPVADNSTPEGRARNRRVEIKIYNSYSSDN